MPEEVLSKATSFEYLKGEAKVAIERLHDCADNTLNRTLRAQLPQRLALLEWSL